MKKRKKLLVFRTLALSLSAALLLSSFPVYATPEESLTSPLSAQDATLPIETPAYSFLFQYDDAANKSILLDKILKIGGEVQYEIDSMNCVAAKLTMEQLPRIKEMECVQMTEKNYEYNLLTLDEDAASSSTHGSICENEPLIPEETTESESPSTDTNMSAAETLSVAAESTEETEVQADSIEELRRLLAGEPPVREESSVSPSYELLLPEESAGDELTAVGAHTAFQAAHELNCKGQNRKIALFDTGVSAHPDLQIAGGVSFAGDPNAYNDTNGHGTQMAGIIAASGAGNPMVKGAAPEAQLYAVKLTDGESFINTAAVLKGIEWAIAEDMDIISMSFGTYFYSKLLERALELAQENGILVVAPAGNDGGFAEEYRLMYPAAYDAVIAVGAGGAYGTESFSNNNEQLDFVAPGRLDTLQADGAYTRVVGTSASAAYVTGILAGLWSHNIALSGDKLLNLTKNTAYVSNNQKSYVGYGEINVAEALQSAEDNAILNSVKSEKLVKNNTAVLEELELKEEVALADVNTEMPAAMAAGNCFANEMANAISISFIYWKSGRINCPGNEVWYKFMANASGVHPDNSPGWYTVHTQGSLDTVGYLYDSSGNQIAYNDDDNGDTNFGFWAQLNKNQTYYIRVKAFGSDTGNYDIRVSYFDDDYGNTLASAYNGSEMWGTYYEDKSISGYLHGQEDIDFFKFVPARDCVMDIYTDGSTNTTGALYDECGNLLIRTIYTGPTPLPSPDAMYLGDDNGNGNGNFRITAHLKAMKFYYIAVSHSSGGYGDYTLKFKFVKDYNTRIINDQYNVVYWHNDNQSPTTGWQTWLGDETRHYYKVFISDNAKGEYRDRCIDDIYNIKSGLSQLMSSPVASEVLSFLISYGIDFIPVYGPAINMAIDVGKMILSGLETISYVEREKYISCMNQIDKNPNQYIIITNWEHSGWLIDNFIHTGNTIEIDSGNYYGSEYERGEFSKVALR